MDLSHISAPDNICDSGALEREARDNTPTSSSDEYAQAVSRVQRDPRYIEVDAKRAHWWKVYREADAEQNRALANSAYNMASDYKRQAEAIMEDALARFSEVDA